MQHKHLYNVTDRWHSVAPRSSQQLTYHRDNLIIWWCAEPRMIPHYSQGRRPASCHHTRSAIDRAPTSPSASLYPYISKLHCQAQWTPYKAAQPPHRRSEKPGTTCNTSMILIRTRYKAPRKPCKPFFLKDDNLYSWAKQALYKPSQADFRKQGHNQAHGPL